MRDRSIYGALSLREPLRGEFREEDERLLRMLVADLAVAAPRPVDLDEMRMMDGRTRCGHRCGRWCRRFFGHWRHLGFCPRSRGR